MKKVIISSFVVAVALLVMGIASEANADVVVKRLVGAPCVVSDCQVAVKAVPAPLRIYRRAVPAVVATPVVVAAQPAYQIVESPKSPFVVRGIFTDRVRIPRRPNLDVVPVQ